MQFRRVLSLLLSVFLLAGLLTFPAAADEESVALEQVEFYYNAPTVGSLGEYANPGIWYSNDACFCIEGGDEWQHKYPENSEDQGYYLIQPGELIEAGETYYLDMSVLAEEGYELTDNTVIIADSYNGRSCTLDFNPVNGNLELAYTAGPGISQHPMDQYGLVGSIAEFDVYMDCEDDEGIAGYQWQYSKNGGKTWYSITSSNTITGYDTAYLQVPITANRDGFLYRCVITDDWGETIVSDPACLVMQKPLSSVDVLTEQPISGTSVDGVGILDAQGNDITGDQSAMTAAYRCIVDVSFNLADFSAYPSAFIGNREYLVTIYGSIEGMDNTNEYYFTDDLTVTWNGYVCEVSDVYDTGFTATTTYTIGDSGISLDLRCGAVALEEDNGQALANTLLALYKRQYPPLMLWYQDYSQTSFGNLDPNGYVDYILDLNDDNKADVCLHWQAGSWTVRQLETCSMMGAWSAKLDESEKQQLEPAFFDWIKIIPYMDVLEQLDLTFDEPEIGSSWCDPNLRAENPNDACLEGFTNWEVQVVDNGDEFWTPDLGTFTAGETYRIEGSVIAETRSITLDTAVTVTSSTGREASWEWEYEPEGEGASMAIYFTLGAAFTQQPKDVYANLGEPAVFHAEAAGAGAYRWQYSKDGQTWTNVGSTVTGYNTDTLTTTATAAKDGNLYRLRIKDPASGEYFYSDPARLIVRKAITSLDLTIAEPRPGDSFYRVQLLDAQGNPMGFDEIEDTYHCNLELWFESSEASNGLEAGKTYELVVSAFIYSDEDEQGNPLSEYYFDENATVTVNGKACEIQELDSVGIYAVCDFDVDYLVVPEVAFSFIRPEVGPVGNYTMAQISWDENNGLYTIMTEEAYWMTESEEPDPTTSGGYVYEFDNFEYGKTYVFEVMLEGIGTIFTENTVYVITDNYGNSYTPLEIIQDEEYKDYAYVRVACTLSPAPVITQQPVDYVGAEGSTASFTVVAVGAEPLTYQWWIRNPGENEFTKSTRKTATYSTTLKAASNGRELYCVVTDANGNSVISDTVTMSIEASLTITQQPVDYVGAEGSTASFTVVAQGAEPLSYQWWIRNPGENEFTKSTRKTATYSTTLKAASNGRELYCVVTDASGNSVISDTVTMSIEASLTITQQPVDYVGAEGSTASFTVVAQGQGTLTYQWWIRNPGENEFTKSTRKTATYSTTLKAASNGRELYCVVTDANGNSVTSDTVSMSIEASLTITQQPVDYVGAEGSTATFTVVAVGAEPLSYRWWIRNPGENEFTLSTRKTATYSTTLKAASNGRELYCVVTDANGNSVTSDTVTMTIEAGLTITQQPVDYVGAAGSTASFTVVAEGNGPLTYQWWIRNPGENEFTKSTRKTATYSTTLKAASNGRELYCVVTDASGNSVTSDTVTMTIEAGLTITQQPVDYVGVEGSTASFTVVAEGEGSLSYQWWIRNPGENEFTQSTRRTATYSTTLKAASNGRELYCVVTDASGNSVTSDVVTMTIEGTVTIARQPVNYVGAAGSTASFTVVAVGEGLTYQWWIRNPGETEFSLSTRRTATYTTTLKAASSGRELYCVVTDAEGNSVTTDTVTMTIG